MAPHPARLDSPLPIAKIFGLKTLDDVTHSIVQSTAVM